jgi:aspartate/methionine/tyrosine aminotransferase
MRLDDFKLEQWLNPRAAGSRYNLGASCVKAMTINELMACVGRDPGEFLEEVGGMSMHYGHFDGLLRLRSAIAGLFRDVSPDMVLTVHGGTGANNMVINAFVEPGDVVVAVMPNYQQHYSIPRSLGAEVRMVRLEEKDDYELDLDALRRSVDDRTTLITLSNPNNPIGTFFGEDTLREIGEIAAAHGAYVLCDEIYRGLDDAYMPSIVDVYEKGISTGSMSKVFSLAGTRVGWSVTRCNDAYAVTENRRSYDTVCDGPLDELIAAVALEHHDEVLTRSREIVRTNRRLLDEWLPSQPHLRTGSSLSTTALVRYDYDIDSHALCADILKRAGVLLCYGDCFEEPHSFRLGYGFDDPDVIVAALEELGSYLDGLQG